MINIIQTEIEDVKIIKPTIYKDDRGYFCETYNHQEFIKKIGKINFVQDNESMSTYGVLRGLHYQSKPYEQSKLVRVIKGRIQDIAVDIRIKSPTYLKYISVILSEQNNRQLFIPKGFAHGFLVLSQYAIVNYKVDAHYDKKSEKQIYFNHNKINIKWKIDKSKIITSIKDKKNINDFF